MTKRFTSESVFPTHPDKCMDVCSDSILDAALEVDPMARVAVECMAVPNKIILGGEMTLKGQIDFEKTIREAVKKLGYVWDNNEFKWDTLEIENNVHTQSPDISMGVDRGGAGDNGIMFGYACKGDDFMPLTLHVSRALEREFRKVCAQDKTFNDKFRPDGKTQVTICGNVAETVVFNVQTCAEVESTPENGKAYRQEIVDRVILPVLKEHNLKVGKIHVNPTGAFVVGGPNGDCGLTGRKIVVASYGGAAPVGGGAQSGKDPSKVDKSAMMMARYIAKNVVAADIAPEAVVQIGYAIGVVDPVSIIVEGPGIDERKQEALEQAIRQCFDCTVKGICDTLKLRASRAERGFSYADLAAYGYVGTDAEKESDSIMPWEKTDKVDDLKAAFETALKELA